MPRAYAKINLGLQIIGKREDGYHDIETVFYPVNLFDTIELEACGHEIVIESSDPNLPVDESNLCWKAADAIRKEANVTSGVKIHIDKRIPTGAGLGGGSSDAALVLRELPRFWNLKFTQERLREMALSLGSDVPYFLCSGTAFAAGRGDVLEYFDLSLPYWIVVVYPNIHISSKWAYEHFAPKQRREPVDLKKLLVENVDRPSIWVDKLKNDFEELVFRTHEAVRRTKKALYTGGADFALMSGSGSAVFGLFQNELSARQIVKSFSGNLPVFVTEPNFRPER
ncbi:MAG: 4-(cytidine 5'-diphospho)-2-C-methyl-D-erythritol kinase [Bacteroidota bacterium]